MDIRDLIKAMDLLENGIQVDEAFNAKTIEKQVGGIADEQQRAQALAKIALDNGLPGLYDPVKGNFVNTQGQISNTADKDTDYLLASKGLMPKNANTSTFFGRMFGTSGDKYDAGLRGQSDQVIAGQEAEEFKREKLTQLQALMKELLAMKPGSAKSTGQSTGQAGSAVGKGINQLNTAAKDVRAGVTNESIEFKGSISRSLVESFGYESTVEEEQTDEGIGAVLSRAAPGAGAALGVIDAADRWKQGDKFGAVLSGLSGAFSLVPGLGWIPALGFAAANMARDYAKSKSADSGQGTGQSATPTGNGDPKLMKLQKIIGATPDGIMGPETKGKLQAWQQKQGITADGLPGPETYGKAGIKESAAESIRSLQQRLAMLEADTQPDGLEASPEAQAKPDAPDQQEASLADMITKAGGQFVEFPPGHPKAGMQVLVVKKDVGPIVDPSTMEILDNATLAPTGQTFDPKSAGLAEGQLDEGLWDSIVKGAMALGKGAKNFFTAPAAIAKGATAVGADGAKYTWHGAQWVNNATGRVATKQIAAGLGKTTKGGLGGRALANTAKVVKNNPGKTIAGMAGLGYLSGLGGGQSGSASPTQGGGGGGGGNGGTTDKPEEAPACTPEMIAKIGEIKKVMGELSSKIKDPAVDQVIASYQEKIDALNCQTQSASPTEEPAKKWTGVQYGTPNS